MRFQHPELLATWPAPNYVDPERRGIGIYIINGFFFFLATVSVFTRLYTRIFVRRWFGLDDAFIVLGLVCGAGDVSAVFWGYSHYYWDRHMWDGKPEFLIPGAKTTFVAKLFWICSSSCIRFSLLCFFYRLLDHAQIPKYRWVLHCVTLFVASILLAYLGTIIFACVPVQEYFYWPGDGVCIDELYADTILSVFNTFSEFLIAVLPIPVILHLKMDKTQRRSVICLLCVGLLVGVVGCVRTYYVWTLFSSDDLTWYAGPHWTASEVEICVAMICACAPALRPLIGRILSRRNQLVGEIVHKSSGGNSVSTRTLDDKTLSVFASQAERLLYRPVDLEGIAVDGYGYTVTITANNPSLQRKRRRYFSFGGNDSEQNLGITSPRRSLIRMWSVRRTGTPQPKMSIDEQPIEIITRRSLELRESFHKDNKKELSRGWDRRNPYSTSPSNGQSVQSPKPAAARPNSDWGLTSESGETNRTFFEPDDADQSSGDEVIDLTYLSSSRYDDSGMYKNGLGKPYQPSQGTVRVGMSRI